MSFAHRTVGFQAGFEAIREAEYKVESEGAPLKLNR